MKSLQGFWRGQESNGQRPNTRKPQPQRSFSPTLWALKYTQEGKQTCLLQSRKKDYPEDQGTDGQQPSHTESWTTPPSQAIQTAEVTSSSPQAVAYTSFSSLTFTLVSSEHWGGERTCPRVKDAQLKSHQSFQAALWTPGSQQPSHHTHPHQMSKANSCWWGQRSHCSLKTR